MIKLKGLKDKFTIIVGGFNSPILVIDKTRPITNKNIELTQKNITQQNLITVYILPLQITVVYTFFYKFSKCIYQVDHES